jgi:hypothetical protein
MRCLVTYDSAATPRSEDNEDKGGLSETDKSLAQSDGVLELPQPTEVDGYFVINRVQTQ